MFPKMQGDYSYLLWFTMTCKFEHQHIVRNIFTFQIKILPKSQSAWEGFLFMSFTE